jgi:hypothetical protein
MKKTIAFGFIFVSFLFLSGCSLKSTGSCQPQKITIEGYGDPGQKLANCFVEYPGEPSRQDKSYYLVEDICGQFTQEFISHALGKTITRTQGPKVTGLYNCSYFWNDQNDYVMLVLDYLKTANQKIGQEAMGRTVKTESSIPMNNYVVYQEDGLINSIYFILGDAKFISLQRSSATVLSNQELLDFAANIAQAIKNYK